MTKEQDDDYKAANWQKLNLNSFIKGQGWEKIFFDGYFWATIKKSNEKISCSEFMRIGVIYSVYSLYSLYYMCCTSAMVDEK